MERKTLGKIGVVVCLFFAMALFVTLGSASKVDAKYKFKVKSRTVYAKIGKKVVIKPVIKDKRGRKVKVKVIKGANPFIGDNAIINGKKFSIFWREESKAVRWTRSENPKKLVIKKLKLDNCYNGPKKCVFKYRYYDDKSKVEKVARYKIVATNIKKYKKRPKKCKIYWLGQVAKNSFTIFLDSKTDCSYVTGYRLKYSRNKNMKKSKVIFMEDQKRIRGLKNGKYYIKARVYGIYNGKKYYGKWSKKKSIVVKNDYKKK